MKFSYAKNPESEFFFYTESKSNKKKKKSGGWEGRGWCVARVSDFFFIFKKESKESKSEKNLFEGVKVREDWLV